MPNVVCPNCRTTLGVTEAMLGGEVQCGQCHQVFRTTTVPKRATAQREVEEDEEESRSTRRRSRRAEEEYDDDVRPSRRRSRRDDDYDDRPSRSRSGESSRGSKYCHECGKSIRKTAVICPKCGVRQPTDDSDYDDEPIRNYGEDDPARNRVVAGIMGILFGGLGIHKFILGYGGAGAVMLMVSLLSIPISIVAGGITCGAGCMLSVGTWVMSIIGLIEGIMYLSKSDREFRREHRNLNRPWF